MDSEQQFTPGPWHLELIGSWPFGVRVTANGKEIMSQSAHCLSSVQRTRRDCEMGEGFPVRGATKAEAKRAIAEQDANARLIAAAPELYKALKALLPEGWGDDETMDHMPGVKLARLALAKVSVPRTEAVKA
jgi:hypothetical protein